MNKQTEYKRLQKASINIYSIGPIYAIFGRINGATNTFILTPEHSKCMTYPKQNVTGWEGSVKSKRFPLQWIYLNIHFGIWDLPICGLRKGNPNPKRKTVLTVATREILLYLWAWL